MGKLNMKALASLRLGLQSLQWAILPAQTSPVEADAPSGVMDIYVCPVYICTYPREGIMACLCCQPDGV